MPDDKSALLKDARLLLEQERVWDEYLLMGPPPTTAEDDEKKVASAVTGGGSTQAVALQSLHEKFKDCVACPLGNTRTKFVFGVGNPNADVLFIGEGPGYEEDRRGEPFVGKAGQLLDKILAAIQLDRTRVYIANIVKCHPMIDPQTPEARGNDRPPATLESETCAPILKQQIAIIQPRVIVTLGSPSTRMILQTKDGITKLRGRFFPFPVTGHYGEASTENLFAPSNMSFALSQEQRTALEQIQVLPTYHPAALLRNPDLKKDTWEDMKRLRDFIAQ